MIISYIDKKSYIDIRIAYIDKNISYIDKIYYIDFRFIYIVCQKANIDRRYYYIDILFVLFWT